MAAWAAVDIAQSVTIKGIGTGRRHAGRLQADGLRLQSHAARWHQLYPDELASRTQAPVGVGATAASYMVQADFNTEIDRFRLAVVDTRNTENSATFRNTQHIGWQHGAWVQWQHRARHMLFHGCIPVQEIDTRYVMLARDIVVTTMQQATALYQRAIVNFTRLAGIDDEFTVALFCRWE